VPEMLEVETYRFAAEPLVGRRIERVHAPDGWYAKGDTTTELLSSVLPGLRVIGTRRIGKLMLLDTDGPVLGLRFGMTGRILVDDQAPIEGLEYSSDRNDPAWDRFGLSFHGGGSMMIRDPRRLGGVELDPDETRLGPDALQVSRTGLAEVLQTTSAPIKARLLDQSRIAGLGNLLVDDILYRSGVATQRPADSLNDDDIAVVFRALRQSLATLGRRGGSHTGDLQSERHVGGRCPKDGVELSRASVGGRTSYWCPVHQH